MGTRYLRRNKDREKEKKIKKNNNVEEHQTFAKTAKAS